MERYKRVLSPLLVGKRFTNGQVEREKSINVSPDVFLKQVVDQTITSITRRAKFLAFQLSNKKFLMLHLMLGGKLFFGLEAESPYYTKQITLHVGESALFFIGLRLGYLHILTQDELEAEWKGLGPEPLSPEFSELFFLDRLKKKRGRLKSVLVDQSFVAGIGNRYSDEICFEASLFPGREAGDLTHEEGATLFSAIKHVLTHAIDEGGYLDLPIFKGDKITGGAEALMEVHRRTGEACPRCGETIVEEKIASKKTFYCPNCQH